MSYTNYGKCRNLSVIWEFSKKTAGKSQEGLLY
jgi:hypothetical protein